LPTSKNYTLVSYLNARLLRIYVFSKKSPHMKGQ